MPTKHAIHRSSSASWWLADGDEVCPHCGAWYVYELEFRCTECDGPGCPHCKVAHAEGYWLCPDCSDESKEELHHG